jgi:hypothetical protein
MYLFYQQIIKNDYLLVNEAIFYLSLILLIESFCYKNTGKLNQIQIECLVNKLIVIYCKYLFLKIVKSPFSIAWTVLYELPAC